LGIKFEFTAPHTPEQNGRVERKFAILYEYMRSILNAAKLPDEFKLFFWAEAANHSTDVINGVCTSTNTVPPYKAFYKTNAPYYKYLRPFGELSVIASSNKIKSKMSDRGFLGLYLGRVADHTPDTYRFLNLSTQAVLLSRNVKFTGQMYGDYIPPFPTNNRYNVLYIEDDDNDDDEEVDRSTAPTTVTTLPHVTTNPTTVDDDDDVMPELVPDPPSVPTSPSELSFGPYQQIDIANAYEDPLPPAPRDEYEDFLPPPAPRPVPNSDRLTRELRKLDGHLNFFKHSPPWSRQDAPFAGGESPPDPDPFDTSKKKMKPMKTKILMRLMKLLKTKMKINRTHQTTKINRTNKKIPLIFLWTLLLNRNLQ
jgi:hypothetical protein